MIVYCAHNPSRACGHQSNLGQRKTDRPFKITAHYMISITHVSLGKYASVTCTLFFLSIIYFALASCSIPGQLQQIRSLENSEIDA